VEDSLSLLTDEIKCTFEQCRIIAEQAEASVALLTEHTSDNTCFVVVVYHHMLLPSTTDRAGLSSRVKVVIVPISLNSLTVCLTTARLAVTGHFVVFALSQRNLNLWGLRL
jgi:hypothetical protein